MFIPSKFNNLFRLLMSTLLVVSIASCTEDEQDEMEVLEPLVYNAQEHIYGTITDFTTFTTEVVIELETGRFDSIPGTTQPPSALNSPIGAATLTDFDNDRRIALSFNKKELVIQNLNNFEYQEIPLIDPETGSFIVNPSYLIFGENNNEVYVLNSNSIGSLWLVNLETESIELIQKEIFPDDHFVHYLFYDKTSNSILFMGGIGEVNDAKATAVFIYDLEQKIIVDQYSIPSSFGFVDHPDNENIYCLNLPTDNQGFRLMRLKLLDGLLQKQLISTADLNIDNLSTYIQTIHSATSTYICRSGSSNIEFPTNTIYSIDLTTGILVGEAKMDTNEIIMKLAGE